MNINKKNFLSLSGLAIAGLLALTACGGGEADAEGNDELPSVTLAIPPNAHGLGPATALQEGLFQEHGVEAELEFIQSGAEGAALLAGGDVEFALFSSDNVINSVAEGHNNIMTVPIAEQGPERNTEDPHGFGSIIVDASGDIETLQDLEGEAIGTSVLAGEAFLNAQQTLEEEGVDVSSIEWIQIPGPQHISSILQGQVAATVTPEPNIAMGIVEGTIEPLVDVNGVLPNAPSFGLASDLDWVEENKDVVDAVLGAILEANALLNSDRELAEKNLDEYMELEEEVISIVKLPHYPEQQFTEQGFIDVAERLVEYDMLDESHVDSAPDAIYTGE